MFALKNIAFTLLLGITVFSGSARKLLNMATDASKITVLEDHIGDHSGATCN